MYNMTYMHVDVTLYGECAAPRYSNDQADADIAEAKHRAGKTRVEMTMCMSAMKWR